MVPIKPLQPATDEPVVTKSAGPDVILVSSALA
jgi:hypothetical protein